MGEKLGDEIRGASRVAPSMKRLLHLAGYKWQSAAQVFISSPQAASHLPSPQVEPTHAGTAVGPQSGQFKPSPTSQTPLMVHTHESESRSVFSHAEQMPSPAIGTHTSVGCPP